MNSLMLHLRSLNQANRRRLSKASTKGRGFTTIELLIAMTVLIAVMGLIGRLVYQTDRIWKQIAHHRVAMFELSNQLEELTLVPESDLDIRLTELEPSAYCLQSLVGAELSGETLDDELGKRIVLKLQWRRDSPGRPVQLTGWHQDARSLQPNASEVNR